MLQVASKRYVVIGGVRCLMAPAVSGLVREVCNARPDCVAEGEDLFGLCTRVELLEKRGIPAFTKIMGQRIYESHSLLFLFIHCCMNVSNVKRFL